MEGGETTLRCYDGGGLGSGVRPSQECTRCLFNSDLGDSPAQPHPFPPTPSSTGLLHSGSATDSPDTARAAVLALHRSWVEAAGGRVEATGAESGGGGGGVEVCAAVSYAGEGLEARCRGRTFGPGELLLEE